MNAMFVGLKLGAAAWEAGALAPAEVGAAAVGAAVAGAAVAGAAAVGAVVAGAVVAPLEHAAEISPMTASAIASRLVGRAFPMNVLLFLLERSA
jgi:hypothetical protein